MVVQFSADTALRTLVKRYESNLSMDERWEGLEILGMCGGEY